jgi:hypothetical protein
LKVAFWSNSKENSGVTSNLACISVASAMEYSYKAVLIENHFQKNKLENALIYNLAHFQLKEEADYHFKHVGMNYLINHLTERKQKLKNIRNISERENVASGKLEKSELTESSIFRYNETSQLIKEVSLEILNNSLYYIPPCYVTNSETFEYDLYGNIDHILEMLESFADITYIDTSNRNNLSSKVILDEVDLVVVNLTQNRSVINHFFENYSSILSKCVFLISNYRKESELSVNKISKTYLINKSSIATIPYNVEYQSAISKGMIVDFLYHNYTCKRTNPNYYFINDIKKAVFMIMNRLEENTILEKTAVL